MTGLAEPADARRRAPRDDVTGTLDAAAWRTPSLRSYARYAAGVALLIALYYGAAHIGYAGGFAGPVAAITWLPVGVGVAFLYRAGPEYWPGVVLGDLLVNNYSALPLGSAVGQSAGNLIEVLVAALLMRRLVPCGSPLGSIRGLALTVCGLGYAAVREGAGLTYIVLPAPIWAALRFRERGASLAVAIAAGFAVWETSHFEGAFITHSIGLSVLSTQLFIAVAALSTLSLAAVASEREAFSASLIASRERLVEAADTERRRLERNLHDGVQGRLSALLVRLGLARERARTAPETSVAMFAEAQREIASAIEELRELSHGLLPSMLAEHGLRGAVENLVERSAVPIEMLEMPAARFDGTAETTAYYVIAEATTNVHKNAQAASIRVRVRERGGWIELEVVDDGRGGASETDGFGLQGLRDRVEATGGTFEVDSGQERGTRVAARIPAGRV